MELQRQIDTVMTYIRQDIVASLTHDALTFTPEEVWDIRSRLHVLHHYCLQSETSAHIGEQIEFMLDTSAALWKLLSDNIDILGNLKDYTNVRLLSAEAEVVAEIEEIISGEESLRDILIVGIAFILNWKANTIWVNSARKARKSMIRGYIVELQDQLWEFIKAGSANNGGVSLDRARRIGKRADQFLLLITASGLPDEAQVAILIQIFVILLRLQLGRIIKSLKKQKAMNEG